MRTFFISLLFAFCFLPVSAQITGRTIDNNGKPIGFINVVILNLPDSSLVNGATTNDKGFFKLAAVQKKSLLRISALGYGTIFKEIGPDTHVLGDIKMTTNEKMLDEAAVVAKKPLIKTENDRIAYSVADDPSAKTSTVLEMLRKVPMVTVDGQDNIKVKGNSGFKVYVNGKLNTMISSNPSLILKNFPAASVKRIEVITDPGAKYDAEGVAGIINIVTESDAKTSGYTITPGISMMNNALMGNVTGMAQYGKLTLSTQYVLGNFNQPTMYTNTEQKVFATALSPGSLLTSESKANVDGFFQMGNLEASYEFDKHNLLSVSAGVMGAKVNVDANTFTQSISLPVAGSTMNDYSYNSDNKMRIKEMSYNASADYQHTFDRENRTLTLSYRLNTSPGYNRMRSTYFNLQNVSSTLYDQNTDPETNTIEHTGQLDFTSPLGSHQTLSTGIKYINRLNKSDNDVYHRESGTAGSYVVDDDNSLNYRHNNDILAGYGEYTYKLGGFSSRAGLRYEYSHVKVSYPDHKHDTFNSYFNDLVPSFNLSYNFSPVMMLKADYNMRIGRPDISFLSPYVVKNTPENISYGNPNLKSEHSHNFALTFSSFSGKFSLNTSLSYSVSTDGLTNYSFMNDNVYTTTYGNSRHTKQTMLDTYLNWNFTKSTSFTTNLSGGYVDYKSYRTNSHESGFSGNIWASVRQELPFKLKLDVMGGGNTCPITLQGRGEGIVFYGMSLSRTFLKEDRLQVTLQANNFIHPRYTMSEETSTSVFHYKHTTSINMLQCGIGISYRIGKLRSSVKKVAHSIENSDVKKSENKNVEIPGQNQLPR